MKFLKISDLLEGLEAKEILQHEIKGKRLRKQLKVLEEMEPVGFSFESFEILPAAIAFYVNSEITQMKVKVQETTIYLELRLDS